jgi:hypothetical protein
MSNMSNQALITKIERKFRTIRNFTMRGAGCENKAAAIARQDYDSLKDEMESREMWDSYCEKHGFAEDHTGFDVAA